jgi:hypothetical protein
MSGNRALSRWTLRRLAICAGVIATLGMQSTCYGVVKIFDGFGDADRNNDGSITADTDLNDSGTLNDFTGVPPMATGPDSALANRGITEVTAATDPSDVGAIWSGIRSFDTAANLVKSKLRIINDNVPVGVETAADIHNDGLALGVESRGGGSSFIGRFGQSIALGPVAGDKVVVSFDWRVWREANDNASAPAFNNALRWGIYQDTDSEFGMTAPYGTGATSAPPGAIVMWGRDDGNWFASQPGAEGDKGINTEIGFGATAVTTSSRIRWEHNVAGINGTSPTATDSNGRILEGGGVSDTPGIGGDTATIATPVGTPPNGPGGIITNLSTYAPHNLKMEIIRTSDGLVEVAAFVDNNEYLRDSIKTTDTGYNVLAPVPFSYDYVAIRNATNDWDYVIDNFMVEVFGSNVGVAGDYNGNGVVDGADYVLWRNGGPLQNEVADAGTVSAADYTEWRLRFGNTSGSGSSLGGASVPEPNSILMLLIGGIVGGSAAMGRKKRG